MIQVLLRLDRFDEAETYVRSAETLGGDAITPEHRIRFDLSHAEIHLNRGEFGPAMEATDAALTIAGQGLFGHLDMWCLQVQAHIHLNAGRPDAARTLFEEELRRPASGR